MVWSGGSFCFMSLSSDFWHTHSLWHLRGRPTLVASVPFPMIPMVKMDTMQWRWNTGLDCMCMQLAEWKNLETSEAKICVTQLKLSRVKLSGSSCWADAHARTACMTSQSFPFLLSLTLWSLPNFEAPIFGNTNWSMLMQSWNLTPNLHVRSCWKAQPDCVVSKASALLIQEHMTNAWFSSIMFCSPSWLDRELHNPTTSICTKRSIFWRHDKKRPFLDPLVQIQSKGFEPTLCCTYPELWPTIDHPCFRIGKRVRVQQCFLPHKPNFRFSKCFTKKLDGTSLIDEYVFILIFSYA